MARAVVQRPGVVLIYRVMFSSKKMPLLFAAVIVLCIIALGVWWHLFFRTPNPPLQQMSVSIQNSSTVPVGVASSTGVVSSTASSTASAQIVEGENPPLTEESLSVDGVTFTVEIASSPLEEARGLSFRPSLGVNDGMLFTFGSGGVQTFWMKDMNFPLDMIWISGNTVVGFAQDAPPPAPGIQLWQLPIFSSPDNTDKVLEVNAGTVAKYNIKVGDTVTIGALK